MDLLGAYSWRRRFAPDDPNVAHLEKAGSVAEDVGLSIGLAQNIPKCMVHDGLKSHSCLENGWRQPVKLVYSWSMTGPELMMCRLG